MIKPPGPSVSKVGALAPSGPIERLRGDTARLLVTVPSKPVQAPGFVVGEAVTARLVEPLQNRQWVAVIKNALFTLQLPLVANEAATDSSGKLGTVPTQGETMSLQVASLTPRLTFALIDAAAAAPASGATAVQLSDAARTLSELLRASERGPLPTGLTTQAQALAASTVLLGDPAASPSERALGLAQAVSHSGLFYESHLLAWAEGRLLLSSLLAEPQARLAEGLKDGMNATSSTVISEAERESASAGLGGLLQRQLDALDGKPLAFTGFAWPGQPAEWRIQRDAAHPPDREATDDRDDRGDRGDDSAEHPPAWTTQIQLTLPRLGALGAQLCVTGSQVTLAMTLDNDASAALLATHRARLASALQAAGLNLAALTVQQPATQDEYAEKS